VSEYQYYEFTAVDRPLTTRGQGELRAPCTRADITATSLVKTLRVGQLQGRPTRHVGTPILYFHDPRALPTFGAFFVKVVRQSRRLRC
jgi:hypothetical protein